jgi:hypothetical protein
MKWDASQQTKNQNKKKRRTPKSIIPALEEQPALIKWEHNMNLHKPNQQLHKKIDTIGQLK